MIDPLDSEASVGYDSLGNVDAYQDPAGDLMYFTWDAADRHSAAMRNPANYVWAKLDAALFMAYVFGGSEAIPFGNT